MTTALPAAGEPKPRFSTVAEVAELYRESEQTTLRRVREGRLPAVRDGRRYLIPREVVAELERAAAAAVSTGAVVDIDRWRTAGAQPASPPAYAGVGDTAVARPAGVPDDVPSEVA